MKLPMAMIMNETPITFPLWRFPKIQVMGFSQISSFIQIFSYYTYIFWQLKISNYLIIIWHPWQNSYGSRYFVSWGYQAHSRSIVIESSLSMSSFILFMKKKRKKSDQQYFRTHICIVVKVTLTKPLTTNCCRNPATLLIKS